VPGEGHDLSDSSDEGNEPDEEDTMYAPGRSIETIRLSKVEAFPLWKTEGDPAKYKR
jgi:hypothetical protein